MFLYLVQHAEARKKEEDPTRDLSEKGLQDIKKVAEYGRKLNLTVNQILHSGKTRALRTAESLAESLKPSKGITETDGLAPLDDPEVWAGRISGMAEDLALVGHLPHLARLAALLLCGDREKSVINFKMGGMVCLRRLEAGQWAVEWMVIPEVVF
jgi:phosphohistidine phosphatase